MKSHEGQLFSYPGRACCRMCCQLKTMNVTVLKTVIRVLRFQWAAVSVIGGAHLARPNSAA